MAEYTKNGLIFIIIGLIIGVVISAISIGTRNIEDERLIISLSVIGIIGMIIALIGGIIVIIGRKEFSEEHEKFVVYAVVVFILGIILLIVLSVFSAIQAIKTKEISSFLNIIIGTPIISSIIIGFAQVLFIYKLQNLRGKFILLTAFILSIIITFTTIYLLYPEFKKVLNENFDVENPNDMARFENKMKEIEKNAPHLIIFGLLPTILYIVAYYSAYNRIKRGELKRREQSYMPSAKPYYKPPYLPSQMPPYGYPPYTPSKTEEKTLPTECKYCGAKFFIGVEVCPKCGAYLK